MSAPKPWPENAYPRPEELAEWLRVCTDEERLLFAAKTITNSERVQRFEEHEWPHLEQLAATESRLSVARKRRDAAEAKVARVEALADGAEWIEDPSGNEVGPLVFASDLRRALEDAP